jgi:hypothetical protein
MKYTWLVLASCTVMVLAELLPGATAGPYLEDGESHKNIYEDAPNSTCCNPAEAPVFLHFTLNLELTAEILFSYKYNSILVADLQKYFVCVFFLG